MRVYFHLLLSLQISNALMRAFIDNTFSLSLSLTSTRKQQTMIALAKRATKTDALKLLLVVFDREALEGRSGLLPGGFPSCIYMHSDQPKCLRKIQTEIFNS